MMSIADPVPKLGSMNKVELTQMLKSLQNLLHKTKELLDKETQDLTDSSLYKYDPNPSLDSKLLDDFFEYVKGLKYHRSSDKPHSPELHLFGDHKYGFNRLSDDIDPTPILPKSVVDKFLCAMNHLLGTNYNSILVNKYRDFKCALGPHKDDEKIRDLESSLAHLISVLWIDKRFADISGCCKILPSKISQADTKEYFYYVTGFPGQVFSRYCCRKQG